MVYNRHSKLIRFTELEEINSELEELKLKAKGDLERKPVSGNTYYYIYGERTALLYDISSRILSILKFH